MAPKKVPAPEQPPQEDPIEAALRRPPPVWVYGINDHLDGPKDLPPSFKHAATLREDYLRLCATVGAVPHPALKVKPKVAKPPAQGRKGSGGQACLKAGITGAAQWGARASPDPEASAEPPAPVVTEDPVLSIRSMLLDRVSVHLLSLLLPAAVHIRLLIFSDVRLDVEMMRLLRSGLGTGTSVESLQIEWNPLELPLPTVEELEAEEAARAADAAAAAAAAAGEGAEGTGLASGAEAAETDMVPTIPGNFHDLEVRERWRYTMQSHRTLRSFKERLADLFAGDLGAAFAALEVPGDADALLSSGEFQGVMEARLGISGLHVVSVFEVLDGPDYSGSEGCVSLTSLRAALTALPEEVSREGVVDAVGGALAAFLEPECGLESLSLRACAISRVELAVMAASLKQCPWSLRILNIWDNYLCDRCAELLASAFQEYRGLEYIGLGRNRITDAGLAAVCAPFNWRVLDEAGLREAQEHVKAQQAHNEGVEKAKAKAKPKAAPAAADGKEARESPLYVDDLKESPAEEDGGEPVWVFRRHTELKTINLSENPIRDARALEMLQMVGPEGADLVLKSCPVSSIPLAANRRQELGAKGRRASGLGAMEGGWVLRML